jgi:hypothetical protein
MVAALLMAAGCANAADTEEPKLTLESAPSVATDLSSAPVVGTGLQRLVDMAKKSLAAQINIEEADIALAEAEYVTWRDSSLGCPKPDMAYLQVLTNGSRIILKAKGRVYHYHSGGNVPPSYCSTPSPSGHSPYAPGET